MAATEELLSGLVGLRRAKPMDRDRRSTMEASIWWTRVSILGTLGMVHIWDSVVDGMEGAADQLADHRSITRALLHSEAGVVKDRRLMVLPALGNRR
jgi:hypothetical protein